ncbi:MAG: hypothetical protein K0S61_87 [Anaerocolumna sp.]|jgi:hypothetical protein|nr:hypothetical protein [Anaerocolumna sp.]
MKKILDIIKSNKGEIAKKALIIGGALLGLALVTKKDTPEEIHFVEAVGNNMDYSEEGNEPGDLSEKPDDQD